MSNNNRLWYWRGAWNTGAKPQDLLDYESRLSEWQAVKKDMRAIVWARDSYRCVLCGSSENLVVDHILSMRRGGSSTPDNLRTLCRHCNCGKSSREDRYYE